MKNTFTPESQSQTIEHLHYEMQGWKSNLQFIEDEIIFIDHLLNSYVFQPNTQNLFERLQDYLSRLKKITNHKMKLQKSIAVQENKLGGMMECKDRYCDSPYYLEHDRLKVKVVDYVTKFRELKSEIFNYAGGIMKKRKPTSKV